MSTLTWATFDEELAKALFNVWISGADYESAPPEFREQMVALVRTGRTPEDLAHEFEPTAQSISNWGLKPIAIPVGGPTASRRPSVPS